MSPVPELFTKTETSFLMNIYAVTTTRPRLTKGSSAWVKQRCLLPLKWSEKSQCEWKSASEAPDVVSTGLSSMVLYGHITQCSYGSPISSRGRLLWGLTFFHYPNSTSMSAEFSLNRSMVLLGFTDLVCKVGDNGTLTFPISNFPSPSSASSSTSTSFSSAGAQIHVFACARKMF